MADNEISVKVTATDDGFSTGMEQARDAVAEESLRVGPSTRFAALTGSG